MSKEYVCDSCGRVILFPHEVKMKEFFVDHKWIHKIGFIPSHKKRRVKKHICDRCFLRLVEVTYDHA